MSRTLNLARASLFAALTAAGAFVKIPLGPVPISLQTFFVYLAGGSLHPTAAALSQVVYILIGASGIPVFSGPVPAGPGALLGPTGGYLAGFVFSAYLIAKIVEKKSKAGMLWMGLALVLGTGVIYGLGVIGLMLSVEALRGDFSRAFLIGVVPFIPGDAAKIIVATLVSAKLRRVLGARV